MTISVDGSDDNPDPWKTLISNQSGRKSINCAFEVNQSTQDQKGALTMFHVVWPKIRWDDDLIPERSGLGSTEDITAHFFSHLARFLAICSLAATR